MTDQAGAGGGGGGTDTSRRTFLKIGAGVVVGAAIASAIEIPILASQKGGTTTTTVTVPPSTSQASSSPNTSSTGSSSSPSTSPATNQQSVLLVLSSTEAAEVIAIANTLIPTDSNGPGATSAGAVYFIDRQLAADYGKNANMYNRGPFVPAGLTSSITVNSAAGAPITYSGGSMVTIPTAGTQYQYGMLLSDFWRYGLGAFETYCNGAYGGNFETLSASNQAKALADLANNKPTSFNNIVPSDFFQEAFLMSWCGFLMDPLYGGNQNMVGWELTGFNGTNQGNFYGEGHTTMDLMVSSTPTRLKPASLAQFQAASGLSTSSTSSSSGTSGSSSSSAPGSSSSASGSSTGSSSASS